MFGNLLRGLLTSMAAPASAGADGSAEGSTPAAANAEEQLTNAFKGNPKSGTGADGEKSPSSNPEGDKGKGGSGTGGDSVSTDTTATPPAWMEQLPQELRSNPETIAKLAKYNKVGDLANAMLELEGKVPTVPKTAEEYAFAKNKDLKGDEFAKIAHSAGLSAKQADAVFKALNETGTQQMQAITAMQERQIKETTEALKAEYGAAKCSEKLELLSRGLQAAGPNVGNLLFKAGLAGNPEIVKAFIAFGEMTAESGSVRGGAASSGSFIPASEGGSLYD